MNLPSDIVSYDSDSHFYYRASHGFLLVSIMTRIEEKRGDNSLPTSCPDEDGSFESAENTVSMENNDATWLPVHRSRRKKNDGSKDQVDQAWIQVFASLAGFSMTTMLILP